MSLRALHLATFRAPISRFSTALALLAFLLAAPASARAPVATSQQEALPSVAEREWQALSDELTPRLVAHRAKSPEERAKSTFADELARIADFVARHQEREPDVTGSARIFMATQILAGALELRSEAVAVLRDVATHAQGSLVAALAALHAGQLLLELGDEAALNELRTAYVARADAETQFKDALAELCRRVRLRPGRPFPDLALVGLDGKPIAVAELRGKLVIILLFNVEHPASRAELGALAALLARSEDPAVAAVGISVDNDRKKLDPLIAELGIRFPIDAAGLGWKSPAAQALGITQIPATFLLDPKGVIRFARVGAVGVELPELVRSEMQALRARGELPPLPAEPANRR